MDNDDLTKRSNFYRIASETAFFLDTCVEHIRDYLSRRDWLEHGESIMDAKPAGQGNMNCIVRIATNRRTFILKQSRPWVEKYSHIAAPFDRALIEAEFYALVAGTRAAEFMPKLYWADQESRILCLEDLGANGDCTNVYSGVRLEADEQEQLCKFLSSVHGCSGRLINREMRALNHHHIFEFPFQTGNGLDLDQITLGLQHFAVGVIRQPHLVSRVTELGQIYLSDGSFLVHGDYFPGSWLRAPGGVKVIDPEFGFSGAREFDVGVMLAHMLICGHTNIEGAVASYYAYWNDLDQQLMRNFSGVEVLRRLLGVAQLPIQFDYERKKWLIMLAASMVLE